MNLSWKFRGLRSVFRPARALRARRAGPRLNVEVLEDRTLLSTGALEALIQPSVDLGKDFEGLANRPDNPIFPPDTHVAAGPDHLVEVVNADIAFYNKASGRALFQSSLSDFFAPAGASPDPFDINFIFDPNVSYDELTGRFIVTAIDVRDDLRTSHLLVAVSDDADPRGAWEMHRINVEDDEKAWGDFPRLGWDADAIYVGLNMFHWKTPGDPFSHVSLITIDKASVLDGDSNTLTYFDVDRAPREGDFTMHPAIMHGAVPGEPMYFVERTFSEGNLDPAVRVVRMTNKLSAQPTFEVFRIEVPAYPRALPPPATQPDGQVLDSGNRHILSAAWRDGRLVATQTVAADDVARARWYEFSTSGPAPTLTQSGAIDQGPGVHTYYPAIEIAPNGDLGMTFMQSSTTEFMSMYVTGRKAADPLGTMHTPVLVKAGEATYYSPPEFNPPALRAGDYSGISVDPVTGSFWAASEYATLPLPPQPAFGVPDINSNWGTWITNFSISGSETTQAASLCATVAAGPVSLAPLQPRMGESLAAIWLGRGWFLEPWPWDDSEFTTLGDQREQNHMDLLTTFVHEIGHLLGHDHEEDGVMADTLEPGFRRTPGSGAGSDSSAIRDLVFSEAVLTKRRR